MEIDYFDPRGTNFGFIVGKFWLLLCYSLGFVACYTRTESYKDSDIKT